MDKLSFIEEKIKKLQAQKQLIENKEKAKQKKLLNKQKIIVGGYIINKLKDYDEERLTKFLSNLLDTIPSSRKADIQAIEELEKIVK